MFRPILSVKRLAMGADVGSTLFLSSTSGFLIRSAFFSTQKKKGSFLLQTNNAPSDAAVVAAKAGSVAEIGYDLIKQRNASMGPNVSVFYKQDGGLVITKGEGMYLIDMDGNKYLDFANNVACVGHSHPTVVKAGTEALSQVQTNGRFLHPTQQRYVAKLLKTFPPELNTVYLVNSGSEANDLALRMAREHTTAKKPKDVIVLDSAYHGHTQSIMDISPYKWRQAVDGRNYCPETTHVVDCPDAYRGPHRGETIKTGKAYAKDVKKVIKETGGVGTFIAESIVGCGGQIMLPPSYLKEVYKAVRDSGGVCIADEVQTGFARAGTHFWTFQTYDVVPDIVTVGKPMGNGYPVAAVICKREVAESFAKTGIEYFNTYGGNSVACSIAEAVLDTIETEKLQENALKIGQHFRKKMLEVKAKHDWVGDVRGIGLFQGVEFVRDRNAAVLEPYPELTKFVVDFLMFEKVIISRDGPDENVIKFKPPMVIEKKHVNTLASAVDRALTAAKESGRF